MPRSNLHCLLAQENFRRSLNGRNIVELFHLLNGLHAYHVGYVDIVDDWLLKQEPLVIESFNKKIKRKVEVEEQHEKT